MTTSPTINSARVCASRSVPASVRGTATSMLIVMLAVGVAASLVSPGLAGTQRRTTQRPEMARRTSIFDQGYGKGYGDGFGAGEHDWDNSSARDFLGSDAYLNRQQAF